jgi:hypothetical protein
MREPTGWFVTKTGRAAATVLALVLIAWAYAISRTGDNSVSLHLLSGPGATFTLAAPEQGWSIIAYGDMRFTNPSNTDVADPMARQALVARIASEKPNLVLLSGDVPYQGGNPSDWEVYRQETASWREAGLEVFPALGNHELYAQVRGEKCIKPCLENWWDVFPRLRDRRWYSVRYGSAYILTVDSDIELTPGSEQAQWVGEQLAQLPNDVRYVFVSLHHPPMADPVKGDTYHQVRPNEAALARQLEEAAAKIRAKIIVVAGHIHNYERFERNGVVYLVAGGGGAEPYEVERSAEDQYKLTDFPNYHYLRFVCEKDELRAEMVRMDAHGGYEVRDRFVIEAASQPSDKPKQTAAAAD